ncbi:MAG: hypothetical protein HY791_08255 [Deltaproteobacteria bacterium]|nr:hypothetical protein [Deltaproteobacteria bacterium]
MKPSRPYMSDEVRESCWFMEAKVTGRVSSSERSNTLENNYPPLNSRARAAKAGNVSEPTPPSPPV